MFVDLIIKSKKIRFKIFTSDAVARLTSLFQALRQEFAQDFPGHHVDSLWEIKSGDTNFSGPSYAEFAAHYEESHGADSIRMTVQVRSPELPNATIARATVYLDRATDSSFEVVGRNNNDVNGIYSRFNAILQRTPSGYVVLHSPLYEMCVQLVAVVAIAVFSIYAANEITRLIRLAYSEVYVFVVVFLVLSNIWSYVGRGLTALRANLYPIVDIRRERRKPFLLAAVSFVGLSTAGWAVKYILDLLVAT